jgi:hypothetical protein
MKESENGEDPAVVVGCRRKPELGKDVVHM